MRPIMFSASRQPAHRRHSVKCLSLQRISTIISSAIAIGLIMPHHLERQSAFGGATSRRRRRGRRSERRSCRRAENTRQPANNRHQPAGRAAHAGDLSIMYHLSCLVAIIEARMACASSSAHSSYQSWRKRAKHQAYGVELSPICRAAAMAYSPRQASALTNLPATIV